jgi:hypothetical protein
MEKELIHMLLIKKPTTREVLSQFQILYDAPKEKLKNLEITQYDLIQGKNMVMGVLIEQQIAENQKFVIDSPFENTCKKCKGSGELYRFSRKEIEIDCPKCKGEGGKKGECRCKNTDHPGKFYKKMEDDLFIKTECKHCKGTLEAFYKCDRCRGEGKTKIWVIDRIEHRSVCDVCNGRGFFPAKKKKESDLAVIPKMLGEQIKEKMKENESMKQEKTAMMMIDPTPSPNISFWQQNRLPIRSSVGNPECPRPEEAI